MCKEAFWGTLLPFFGTCLGSALVFCYRGKVSNSVNSALCGLAAGIMTAAAVWSLLIPAIERSSKFGVFSFLPSVVGFWAGVILLLVCDKLLGRFTKEGEYEAKNRNSLSFFAVTLHNIPEGMAVGMVWTAYIMDNKAVSFSSALALCLGVAIQNIPEGAIVSMPFRAEGKGKVRSFLFGVFSGMVEPVGAVVTILATSFISSQLPFLLAAAAGAMIYVTADKLIIEMRGEDDGKKGMYFYTAGFTLMMALDVALG